jgi:hypothetical protein
MDKLTLILRSVRRKEMFIAQARKEIMELIPAEKKLFIRPGKPKNSRFNKEVNGWNACRQAIINNFAEEE